MSNTVHVFDFLEQTDLAPAPVNVVFGDEPFLRRLAVKRLTQGVLGDDPDVPFACLDGHDVQWRDVVDELATVSLFGGGGRRLVVVEKADGFVSEHRGRLEDYVQQPKPTGVLVLEVESWPANTRLFKTLDKTGLQIVCRPPEKQGQRKALDEPRICQWLAGWAQRRHELKLPAAAAQQLWELVGAEFGLLDQELAKLALLAGRGGSVTSEQVGDVVGGWRAKTTWELIDAAADGNAASALGQLDRLLHGGEHPVALLGQIAWSLRRLAAATQIYQRAERRRRRVTLRDALLQAGLPAWNRKGLERAEAQLKQLGRDRAGRLYRWLLEADLAMKGSHSAPHRARLVLEQLIVRMSQPLGRPAAETARRAR